MFKSPSSRIICFHSVVYNHLHQFKHCSLLLNNLGQCAYSYFHTKQSQRKRNNSAKPSNRSSPQWKSYQSWQCWPKSRYTLLLWRTVTIKYMLHLLIQHKARSLDHITWGRTRSSLGATRSTCRRCRTWSPSHFSLLTTFTITFAFTITVTSTISIFTEAWLIAEVWSAHSWSSHHPWGDSTSSCCCCSSSTSSCNMMLKRQSINKYKHGHTYL